MRKVTSEPLCRVLHSFWNRQDFLNKSLVINRQKKKKLLIFTAEASSPLMQMDLGIKRWFQVYWSQLWASWKLRTYENECLGCDGYEIYNAWFIMFDFLLIWRKENACYSTEAFALIASNITCISHLLHHRPWGRNWALFISLYLQHLPITKSKEEFFNISRERERGKTQ